MKKQVTSEFTAKEGQIKYTVDVDYWDEKKGKYRIFSSKDRISIYRDTDLIAAFGDKYEDLGRLFKLINSMDANNMIGIYDRHLKHYCPVTSKQMLYNLLGIKARSTGAAFYKKLKDMDIIKEWHDDEGRTVFYINPVYTMSDRGITLTVYKLFYDTLNKVLPYKAKQSLQALCSNPAADNSQVVSYDNSDNVFVDGRLYNDVDEIAAQTDTEKQSIFNEYILRDSAAKTYQKVGKGMIAHPMTTDNDTYFLPNQSADYKSTKPKNEDITEYRAWYIDIDAGRDEDRNYFDLKEVAKRKEKMMEVINALPVPTVVVDTRNGFHAYYACYGEISADLWQQLQDKLIESAKIADPACRDASRLLRLPNSKWIKAHTGLAPYAVTILQANRQAYDAASFAVQMDQCADTVAAAAAEYLVKYPMLAAKKSRTAAAGTADITKQSARVQAIADLSDDTFTLSINTEAIDNINDYLHQIDLADFLQISNPASFCCILHNDNNPSASIYANETGYRYYCASVCAGNGHGHGIDIIDIVQNLAGCSYRQAINYLCRVYGVRQQTAA